MSAARLSRRRRRARPTRPIRVRLQVEQLEGRDLPSASSAIIPGELLVSFKPGISQADIAGFYAQHNLSELQNLDLGPDKGLRLIATPTPLARELIATLQQDPRVRYAEPNFVVTPAQVPNDPDFPRDWGLRNTGQTGGAPDADIDADEAWDVTTGSGSIVVGVIDTGVDYTHPDLAANMWTNSGEIPGNKKDDDGNGFVDDYYGYDFANDDGDPFDDLGLQSSGHGTHVAGTIGMVGNNAAGATGVNWNVKIMALRTDGGAGHSVADLVAAYNYTVLMRSRGVDIRVTNNSYGGPGFSQALKDAIDAMGQAGILFVAGAMNNASDNDVAGSFPASFDSPHIIAVAATDASDRIASFSNWGATSVDLAAPGVDVWSTQPGNGYGWGSGTSMATPHVAGAAALVWSAFPDLTALEVKARLLNSVDPIGHIGANASYPTVTNGRLNVRNALLVPAPDNDATPPAAVGNLAASADSPWSVTLTWTAPGDDGTAGRAGFYDVRYSSAPITAATWAAASPARAEPAPRPAGSGESFTVTGLEPSTLYYFAVKVKDNAGNESALSNLAQGNTTPANFLLNDDAESGASNWTATDLWHRSTYRALDSATAWYFGQDSDHTYFTAAQHSGDLTLASPLDLTGVSQAQLRFREWRQVLDFTPLDTARVQVSRNGADWTTVWETFSSSFDWEQRTVDLTPFVGGPVYLRFDFNTNAYGSLPFAITQGYEGWYVDDVQVLVPGAQPAGLSVNDVTVTEGHGGTVQAVFTVTRSSASGRASVHYATADGSATSASGDYQAASGTQSFAPGETRKTVTVPVNGDRLGEADESFVLNLSSPTGAVIADGQGKATILDDEPRILVTGHVVFPEGDAETTFLLAVNLSVPSSQPVTVSYATADGTATGGSDYLPAAGTLIFAPGETRKTIALTLPADKTQDAIVEAFFVNLSGASSNAVILRRGVVHITDDDKNQGHHFGYGGAVALAGTGGGAAGVWSAGVIRPTRAGTVRLDASAAGRGWFVGPTPWENAEFIKPGSQGEQLRRDLFALPARAFGPPPGYEPRDEGPMAEALPRGTHYTPEAQDLADDLVALDLGYAGGQAAPRAADLSTRLPPPSANGVTGRRSRQATVTRRC
jgi:subtilisin family serine protease